MGDHHAFCGHPARYRGCSRYADGVPRLFLGAHEKNVDFHAFRWTAATFLWTTTKLVWATTENMWSLTHLAGLPRQRYGRPRRICGQSSRRCGCPRNVVEAHGSLWALMRNCGRPRRELWARVDTQARYCGGARVSCGRMWARVFLRTWTRTCKGKAKPPTPKGLRAALHGGWLAVYSFAITAAMRDLACFGSAPPTFLSQLNLGQRPKTTD